MGHATNADLALVVVDRAGYVRRIENLPEEELALSDALACTELKDATPALEEGKTAPEFTILDSAGSEVKPADFRGRKKTEGTGFCLCSFREPTFINLKIPITYQSAFAQIRRRL